jgi:large subunit ribosomal protein L6
MSRLGKQKLTLPNGVTFTNNNDVITVKGPKGELTKTFLPNVLITQEDGVLTFSPKKEDLFSMSLWGTYASHVRNMVKGVTEGYTRKLILEGVGFKSEVKGQNLDLALGFSHPVIVEIPNDLTVTAEKNNITITGIDKEKVGQFAAKVRALKKPEPYKGKGFRYDDEVIRRKQGKKAS